MTHTTLKVRWMVTATVAACVLAACGQQKGPGAAGKPGAPGAGAQQMTVSVVTVKLQDVPLVTELQGRTKPHLVAEVRPQVTGIIQKRLFEEGAQVKAGQVLYQIDPSSYQATYDSAQAKVAKAKAQLASARSTAKRYENLGEIAAVSQQQREDAQSALLLAQAAQKEAEAALRSARILCRICSFVSACSSTVGIVAFRALCMQSQTVDRAPGIWRGCSGAGIVVAVPLSTQKWEKMI